MIGNVFYGHGTTLLTRLPKKSTLVDYANLPLTIRHTLVVLRILKLPGYGLEGRRHLSVRGLINILILVLL